MNVLRHCLLLETDQSILLKAICSSCSLFWHIAAIHLLLQVCHHIGKVSLAIDATAILHLPSITVVDTVEQGVRIDIFLLIVLGLEGVLYYWLYLVRYLLYRMAWLVLSLIAEWRGSVVMRVLFLHHWRIDHLRCFVPLELYRLL